MDKWDGKEGTQGKCSILSWRNDKMLLMEKVDGKNEKEKKDSKESVPSCLAEMIGCSAGGALDRFVPNKQKCTFKYYLMIK